MGGWQSSWDMDRWGGTAAIKLLAFARNVANQMTTDQQGVAGQGPYPGHFAVTWIGNMWANINRSGDANEYHSHPGSYWSGTYYVDDGGIDADPALGGELEFLDPRGPVPLMNAPHLRIAGNLSAGSTERIRPKAGKLVMFPSWVFHQVRPYHGTAERISIAFNLTVVTLLGSRASSARHPRMVNALNQNARGPMDEDAPFPGAPPAQDTWTAWAHSWCRDRYAA